MILPEDARTSSTPLRTIVHYYKSVVSISQFYETVYFILSTFHLIACKLHCLKYQRKTLDSLQRIGKYLLKRQDLGYTHDFDLESKESIINK